MTAQSFLSNRVFFGLFAALLLVNCSSSRFLNVDNVKTNQSVRVFLKTGEAREGIVVRQDETKLTIVDSKDHEPIEIQRNEIRQVELSTSNFDYDGYPISNAEIAKYKSSRNTWGYAVGGAAIGAAVGLAIATPIWLANDNPPPLFGAGLGLIVGSIYFGSRGIKKDREVALQQVREIRGLESQLAQEKAAEEEKLRAIEKEKEALLKQLEKKKSQDGSGNQN